MEHTREPWRDLINCADYEAYPYLIYGADQTHVASIPNEGHGGHEENCRRIVACVNACQGIPTEALERNIFHRSPITVALAAAIADMEREQAP